MNKKTKEFYGISTSSDPKDMFNDVLEKGETVQKVYKPDRKKFCWVVRLNMFLSLIWVYFACLIVLESEFLPTMSRWAALGIVFAAVTVFNIIVYLITIIFTNLHYKNRFYAYTNKRVLVRGGIFGIDYKSLEFKSLTATTAKVSLLDRLVRRKTGTLEFGSPSAPLSGMSTAWGFGNPYSFRHIYDPYGTLREIKEVIESCEEKKAKK